MKNLKIILILIVLFSTGYRTMAQTLEQVAEKYNAAAQLINTNAVQALKLMEEAIVLADKVGPEADEVRIMAENQLPTLYFKIAGDLFKEKKTDEAITYFEKTILIAEKYNDASTAGRARDILPKLYFAQGNTFYRSGDNEKAIDNLRKAVTLDPENAKAFMLLGLTYRKLENLDEMMAAMNTAIKLAKSTGDEQTQATCEKSMRDYLAVRANQQLKNNKNDDAVNFLQMATQYGDDATIQYLLALTFNKLKRYDQAIEAAERALALEVDSDIEKAKIWLEIGNAHKEKGNTAEACEAYKKAAFGNFTEQANYQRQHVLKCN